MLSFFFFKNFNLNVKLISNNSFHFLFFFSVEKSIFFMFCFKMSNNLFFYNFSNFFFLVFPLFLKKNLNVVKNSIIMSLLNINFFIKQRLRLSGLGYYVEPLIDSLKLHVGLTKSPRILLPDFVFSMKLNRKKKKLLLKGYSLCSLKNYCSLIRSIKACDVYKHKGIRWRFEVLKTKEGKRSGNR